MSKWVLNTFQGVKVWYSSDVIDKIVSECEQQMCEKDDCDPECECLAKAILDIIEGEENVN